MHIEKRKVYGTILGVTAFVLLIIGITYAIFQWVSGTSNNTNVKLTVSKDLESLIIYKQGTSILETAGQTLNASENYSGGISATIEFYKKPTTKVIYGRINMEILNMLSSTNTTDANIKKTDTIKWAITTWTSSNTTETLLEQGTFNGKEIGNKFPLYQDFELSTTRTFFKIYLWFDQNAVNEELSVSGELLSTEISAEATDVMSMYGDAAVTLNNLGLSVSSGTPDFSKTSCSSGCDESTVGIYESQDDLGTTYYFRGDVENNYVYFANYYWRIIRINGDGGIRMIYDGTTPHDNGESSTDRQIGTSAFNSSNTSNAYVGYKYGNPTATTYEETHANTSNSTIKQAIDSWYKTNISDKGFSSYLVDSIYCNDRSLSSGSGIGTEIGAVFSFSNRTSNPTLYCKQDNDKFTVNTSKGNGSLQYPIGLITADELIYAGASTSSTNTNNNLYLSTGSSYYTMTPYLFHAQFRATNSIFSNFVSFSTVTKSNGVRPVVTLNGSTKLQGTGTKKDPFRLPDPEPNAPDIVDGLIPVVYDESSSTWVKAGEIATCEKLGDANGDGVIDLSDAGLIVGFANSKEAAISKFTPEKKVCADVDGDGKITLNDYELVLNYFNRPSKFPTFPVGAPLSKRTAVINENNSWYDYDNKKWANAVLVSETNRDTHLTSEPGTEIPMDDILAFYVWIPRYKYKVWNISKQAGAESTYAYNAYSEGIDIKFETGTETTGTISCTYNYNVDSTNGGVNLSTTTAETCTGSNGQYYTHPAFTFGSDELRGIWVSKFEISSSNPTASYGGGNVTNLTVRSLPNVTSWRYNRVSNFSTVIQNMQTSSNIYGLSTLRTNTDSHMLTNFEWGAVAYLTNSKYGRCTDGSCTEVTINNCSSYITGIGADTVSASNSSATCTTAANKYDGTHGKLASTTGNITGVYDMSGGSLEYVMGNISKVTTGYTFYPSISSFASSWYTTDTAKYVTTYAYDTVYNNQKAYNRGRLGDATAEVVLSTGGTGGWYSDNANFPYSSPAWFYRGGLYSAVSNAGVFNFDCADGGNYVASSSRAALVSIAS